MIEVSPEVKKDLQCYHCGQSCSEETLWLQDKSFCCYGCKTVYEILSENNLCEYYDLESNPGVQLKNIDNDTFAFLDEREVGKKILEFDSENYSRVRFYIPAIHCVSCIWLLENLKKLATGVVKSEVNFGRKSVVVDFKPTEISLGKIARLLASVGYAPKINLDGEKKEVAPTNKSLIGKLAVAAFCFGNVMLFSFPEYLGLDHSDAYLMRIFSGLNILLSIPVFFYSASDYFVSAWKSFQQRQINIDVPIAVGLLALFLRSSWDIISATGPGYLDSFTGLVFFLLVGRWFQGKTYESLAFDRDFKSYFPLAVSRLVKGEWKPTVVFELKVNDTIQIRNMEIVPADSLLLSEKAYIDYSFVTGESKPIRVTKGELVYAGGRLIGQPVELVVQRKTSQSHLTSLWNNDIFQKPDESRYKKLIDRAARNFTWAILVLALVTAFYWYMIEPSRMWLVITSVLMVACPCALALATPFTYGSMLRVFGRHGLYLKNADVIERMASINSVVFDKTGTITNGTSSDVKFMGVLTEVEMGWIKILTQASTHPLSNLICKSIKGSWNTAVSSFKELPGKGIEGEFDGKLVRVGSPSFVGFHEKLVDASSKVFVSIDDEVRGYFSIGTSIRQEMTHLVERLGEKCKALLSGDNESDTERMRKLFPETTRLLFNQTPQDKLHFIRDLQHGKQRVMMLGDGLNDSGALKQSDVGIAVTDDTGVFTPACDGILQGNMLGSLDKFLVLSKSATTILKAGFCLSFFYNVIALSFAVSGYLTPLVAAILMPISSISVVSFSTLAVNYIAKRKRL